MLEVNVSELINDIRSVGIDLDRIDRIYVIEGVLINTEPLRVGKGAGGLGEVDLPVVRLPSGEPFIPGSSIKGVLRSIAESLVRSEREFACEPSTTSMGFNRCSMAAELLTRIYYLLISGSARSLSGDEFEEKVVSALRKKYRMLSDEVFEEVIELYNKGGIKGLIKELPLRIGPCVVCQLFGNTSLASHIDIMDAIPLSGRESGEIPVLSRTRVAIDRFRGASRARALFNYEYVPRGIKWRFKAIIRNVDLTDSNSTKSRIVRSLLKMMSDGAEYLSLGGMRSVGLGRFKLDLRETRATRYVIKDYDLIPEELALDEVIKR